MDRELAPKKRLNIFVKAAIVTFICFCAVSIVGQQFRYNNLCREENELNAQILENKEELEELQELCDHDIDDEYVKRMARKYLGFHMPDEVIYYNNLTK